MKLIIHTAVFLFTLIGVHPFLSAQNNLKCPVSPEEIESLKYSIQHIKKQDQLYRNYIGSQTMDEDIIASIDAMYDSLGMEAMFAYQKSLNLKLDPGIEDSLWQLQHQIDLQNHLMLRGIIETYGYLPEEIFGKDAVIQFIVLMHPPKDWDTEIYLKEYTDLLLPEVKAGRMTAKIFAQFYDDIKCKILKQPQLYGTIKKFNRSTGTASPPLIQNLEASNQARLAIGLPPLKENEYQVNR